jgi:hypothetical protein
MTLEIGTMAVLVVALTAIVRQYLRAVDGWRVLLVAAGATGVVVAASMFATQYPQLMTGLAVFVTAFGGHAAVKQLSDGHAEAVGEAVGRASSLPLPLTNDVTATPLVSPLPLLQQSDPPSDPPGAA